jgi:hypothetical protein
MGRAFLGVVMLGLVAACTLPSLAVQGGERVLIRNGFVVPPGRLLRVNAMSVDCIIASEVFDEQEFNKVACILSPLSREKPGSAWAEVFSACEGRWDQGEVSYQRSPAQVCLGCQSP